jgi:hypothetical protein
MLASVIVQTIDIDEVRRENLYLRCLGRTIIILRHALYFNARKYAHPELRMTSRPACAGIQGRSHTTE